MLPNTPFGYSIFCDDLREEVRNKFTYVGVYNDSLVVDSDFPVTLPRFCIVATYAQRNSDDTRPIKLRVTMPGTDGPEVIVEGAIPETTFTGPDDPELEDPITFAAVNILLSPFTIHAPGLILVRAFYGDEEIKLGSLKVVRAPVVSVDG